MIIPLGREPNEDNLEEVRSLVRTLAPAWGGMSVDSAGEYLGFQVGQKGGTIASWRKPARKYAERALQLGTAGLSAAEGSYLYNSSVAAVLGYVEQLCPTGKEVTKLEQGAIERALHAPHNSVPMGVLSFANQFGMISIVSLAVRSKAALARTARSTCTSWRYWSEELRKARLDHGPMVNLVPGNEALRDMGWWDSDAFADALARADREAPAKSFVFEWNASRSSRRSRPLKLQAAFYNWFSDAGSLAVAAELLVSRVERLTEGLASERPLLLRKLETTLGHMKGLSPQGAWAVLRSLTNGWVTKSRTGSSITTCSFCCGSDGNYDGLKHYLKCDTFWDAINNEWIQLGGGRLLAKPSERLTLIDGEPSKLEWENQAAALLIATDVYHTIRHKMAFDLHAEARASIANARNHGLITVRGQQDPHLSESLRLSELEIIDVSPASDPKPVSDIETTPATPHAELVCMFNIFYDIFGPPHPGHHAPRDTNETALTMEDAASLQLYFSRGFCEPECSELSTGAHHPCCSQYLL